MHITVIVLAMSMMTATTPVPDDVDRTLVCTATLRKVELELKVATVSATPTHVPLHVEWTNSSGKAITYWDSRPLVSIQLSKLVDGKKVAVELTAIGKKEMEPAVDPEHRTVKAGERLSETYDLARWFQITEGSYLVSISRTFNEHSDSEWGYLAIKEVNFVIGAAKNPFRTED